MTSLRKKVVNIKGYCVREAVFFLFAALCCLSSHLIERNFGDMTGHYRWEY